MKKAIDKLRETWNGELPFEEEFGVVIPGATAPTYLQVLAAFVAMNDGFEMKRHDHVSAGNDYLYRRVGLYPSESTLFNVFMVFLEGMLEAHPDDAFDDKVNALLDVEWARVTAYYSRLDAADTMPISSSTGSNIRCDGDDGVSP